MSASTAPFIRRLSLASFTLAIAGAGAAEAGVYRTTYVLTTPYAATGAQITQVVANWSTSRTSGTVQEGDLADWSISLINGANGTAFYVDTAIVSGGAQSIGGVGRTLSDLMFRFDLDTMTAGEFDNMLTGSALAAATGPAFNVYSYLNGFPPPYSPGHVVQRERVDAPVAGLPFGDDRRGTGTRRGGADRPCRHCRARAPAAVSARTRKRAVHAAPSP